MKLTNEIPSAQGADPVFEKHGSPFLVYGKGKVALNDRAVAAKCAAKHMLKYDSKSKSYERYDGSRGIWVVVSEVSVVGNLDGVIVQLGETHRQQDFVRRISSARLSSLCRMMRPHDVPVESVDITGLVHASNGVVDLRASKPKLLPHDPKYPFRASSGIKFDAKANCPKFLKQFLGAALEQADIALVQKYCGSMLLGPNTCHGILIIRGTAGGGKSSLVTCFEKVLGEHMVAHLRTEQLGSRFETSAFLGKRFLVGKDVPGDTLAVSGARMLKSLVGGDLMQVEIKFNPDKQPVRGDFHCIIVSNNNLHIALDGDTDAWSRRLLVVDFEKSKPKKPIPNFAEKLVEEEGSGILNWLIEGALAYRTEMTKFGHLHLNDKQIARVTTLLQDSDNVTEFVKQTIVPEAGQDVTSEELLMCYYKKCENQNWTPVASQTFFTRVPDLLGKMFKSTRRNDITREGRGCSWI